MDISNSKNIIYQSAIYTEGDLHVGDIYYINGVPQKIPLQLNTIPFVDLPDVIGRDNDLQKVHLLLSKSDRVLLVNGLGGIGKTTLAKYYAATFRNEYNYITWINVTSNIKEAFVSNIELLDSLSLLKEIEEIPKDEEWLNNAFSLLTNRMRQLGVENNGKKNLLIIDNANEDIEHTQTLDKISLRPNWKVLVTSREKLIGFTEYELGYLSAEDALNLFYKHYSRKKNDALVGEILRLIDYHTLLIEITAKNAQSLRRSLVEVLERLKKKD